MCSGNPNLIQPCFDPPVEACARPPSSRRPGASVGARSRPILRGALDFCGSEFIRDWPVQSTHLCWVYCRFANEFAPTVESAPGHPSRRLWASVGANLFAIGSYSRRILVGCTAASRMNSLPQVESAPGPSFAAPLDFCGSEFIRDWPEQSTRLYWMYCRFANEFAPTG